MPAVGDYAASAFLSLHVGRRQVIIDANVVRWLCRMLGIAANGETRRQSWLRGVAAALTPPRAFQAYNYAVLDFTMSVCAPRPRCGRCPLRQHCATGQRASLVA